ncbi:acyl-CoA carboxylase subunit epsilon [Streptomyces sp. NPDC002589]|uniref:acyl-CoA carboxylase subunit epsilon n=1 Tax=Streptomyces sp. NPDC002589 TaxID=3154420 RepID=UPI003320A7B4
MAADTTAGILSVLRGNPDETELAALTVVLLARRQQRAGTTDTSRTITARAGWARTEHACLAPYHQAGSWRAAS